MDHDVAMQDTFYLDVFCSVFSLGVFLGKWHNLYSVQSHIMDLQS